MQVSLGGFALYCTETPLKEANLKIKYSLKTAKHEQKKKNSPHTFRDDSKNLLVNISCLPTPHQL